MTEKTETGSLLEAILAVQAEVGTLPKNAVNPHFKSKFTPLDTIVETVGPVLVKNGLVWRTYPTVKDGRPALRYRMAHAPSGEVDEDTMLLMATKEDPQGQGGGITYARRYALCAYLNLVADEDDDGNAGSGKQSAGELARAKSRMGDEEKALLAEADKLFEEKTPITGAQYQQYKDSTGYTAEGLQRLVNWLKERT